MLGLVCCCVVCCLGSTLTARPVQVAALHSSSVGRREHDDGEHGDSHADGGDGKGASSAKGSKKAPRSISMTEKDKPDVIDLVSKLAPTNTTTRGAPTPGAAIIQASCSCPRFPRCSICNY